MQAPYFLLQVLALCDVSYAIWSLLVQERLALECTEGMAMASR